MTHIRHVAQVQTEDSNDRGVPKCVVGGYEDARGGEETRRSASLRALRDGIARSSSSPRTARGYRTRPQLTFLRPSSAQLDGWHSFFLCCNLSIVPKKKARQIQRSFRKLKTTWQSYLAVNPSRPHIATWLSARQCLRCLPRPMDSRTRCYRDTV